MDYKWTARAPRRPRLLAGIAGSLILLLLSPLLLKAPTSGVSSLLAQLGSSTSSDLSKQVFAD